MRWRDGQGRGAGGRDRDAISPARPGCCPSLCVFLIDRDLRIGQPAASQPLSAHQPHQSINSSESEDPALIDLNHLPSCSPPYLSLSPYLDIHSLSPVTPLFTSSTLSLSSYSTTQKIDVHYNPPSTHLGSLRPCLLI